MQLLVPMNAVEVRNAVKGKYPQLSAVSSSASAPKADAVKTQVSASQADAKSPTLASKTSGSAPKSPAVPVVAKSVTSVAPKAAQAPKPVVKKITSTQVAAATLQTNMTIKSLQDTVSSQTQTIEDNQTQINQLTGQLNIANQQVQSLQAQVSHQSVWTLGNLWLVLWLLTLVMLLLQYRKNKQLVDDYDDQNDHNHQEEYVEVSPSLDPSYDETPVLVQEAREHDEAKDNERYEPQLDLGEVSKPRRKSENWEQVELDIPIVEHQPILDNGEALEHANGLEMYDDQALAGEQNDIIQALSQDVDNMEWHQALLEFYVKTNSQNGFKRHYQNMVKSGLMTEGDPLWEEVRKMYLNKWIYQAV
jgi:hypothetical protein